MRVVSVSVRNFRSYEAAAAPLGGGLSVVWGPNGAGKTNMLEAIYFGCTGRSCRTGNDRELVRFGADTARVVVAGGGRAGQPRADCRLHTWRAQAHDGRRNCGRAAARRPAAPARERFPARSAGAGQGSPGAQTGAPRPVRDRALARARSHAPGVRSGARAAQRADRPPPRRARIAGDARLPGTPNWPRRALR